MPSLPSKPRRAEDTRQSCGPVGVDRGLHVGEEFIELHALSDPHLIGGQWFLFCSCGWNSAGDDRPEWARRRQCDRHEAEVTAQRNAARLVAAMRRQQQ